MRKLKSSVKTAVVSTLALTSTAAIIYAVPNMKANDVKSTDIGNKLKLDVEKMQKAAKFFEGQHDFSAFKASGTSSKNSVRKIFKAEVFEQNERICIELTGSGFLYNMVRIISGTLLDVAASLVFAFRICAH